MAKRGQRGVVVVVVVREESDGRAHRGEWGSICGAKIEEISMMSSLVPRVK
jgi:hypothetical protein